jgi:hypothetical protein
MRLYFDHVNEQDLKGGGPIAEFPDTHSTILVRAGHRLLFGLMKDDEQMEADAEGRQMDEPKRHRTADEAAIAHIQRGDAARFYSTLPTGMSLCSHRSS